VLVRWCDVASLLSFMRVIAAEKNRFSRTGKERA
jgi:hypothetical protein